MPTGVDEVDPPLIDLTSSKSQDYHIVRPFCLCLFLTLKAKSLIFRPLTHPVKHGDKPVTNDELKQASEPHGVLHGSRLAF